MPLEKPTINGVEVSFPSPRLCPGLYYATGLNDNFSDRFVERQLNRKGFWTLEEFIEEEVPSDAQMIHEPLIKIVRALQVNTGDPAKPFLQARGTRGAFGKSCDRYYQTVGPALHQLIPPDSNHNLGIYHPIEKRCQNIIDSFSKRAISRHHLDLDLSVLDMTMDNLAILWNQSVGRMFNVEKKLIGGRSVLYGWKAFLQVTDDDVKVFTIQEGEFEDRTNVDSQDDLTLVNPVFSIDFVQQPLLHTTEMDRKDTRGGSFVAETERFRRNFYNVAGSVQIKVDSQLNYRAKPVFRYGFLMLDIGLSPEALLDPKYAVTRTVRTLRYKTLMPATWDISQKLAEAADALLSRRSWHGIKPASWRNEDMYNLFGAIQLSPFITGVNLIPNKLLDRLDTSVRRRTANHAIDYSLSLGNLWTRFALMTTTQAELFLGALPDQSSYNPSLTNGILSFLKAMYTAGLIVESDKYDNYLMDAIDFFSHPLDIAIHRIRTVRKIKNSFAPASYNPEASTMATSMAVAV